MHELTIVTVTYNSSAVIARLLAPLQALGCDIIVVDNGSLDDSQTIAAGFSNVRVIKSANIGYGRAANLGFREVKTPYVLLLNPDVEIPLASLRHMLACINDNPDIAILGANMKSEEGASIVYVNWIVGALMLIRMDALKKVGFFDENIFLFYEETDLCRRFLQAGYRLAVLRAAPAGHDPGSSSSPSRKVLKIKAWHSAWSKAYYYRKHFSHERYVYKCLTKILTNLLRMLRYALFLNVGLVRKNYYECCGVIAHMRGQSAFVGDVGRFT